MRMEKIGKRIRSLSVKLNILIVAILLSVSVLLLAIGDNGHWRAVFRSSERRLERIEAGNDYLAPYMSNFTRIFVSDEFTQILGENSDPAARSSLLVNWMETQPSIEGENENLNADLNSISFWAVKELWEAYDLESVIIETEQDQVTYRVYDKITNDNQSYLSRFGTRTAAYPGRAAEDYASPELTRIGEKEMYLRCIRFGIDEGGECRIWVTYDMTSAVSAHRRFLYTCILLALGLTVAGSVISTLLMRKYITGPIRKLARATRSFVPDADGTYSADRISRVNTRSQDEIGDLSRDIQTMQERIVTDTENLTRMTAERERLSTEMDMARDIQLSMLPSAFPAFPDRTEFSLYASMKPARQVGGDFYDFFLTDEDHLALVIGDVSGKGMPAALFMALSKTLIRNQLMTGCDPAEALTQVNTQLCEQNEAMMFVTVWLAVLELSTGRGTACNAGHENPGLRRSGGSYELLHYKHDPMAGVRPAIRYHLREFEMHPGDCLFVYTDGATDGKDTGEERFGENRLAETLNRDHGADPETLIRRVYEAIDRFSAGTPQFDDITMLCLEYCGKAK